MKHALTALTALALSLTACDRPPDEGDHTPDISSFDMSPAEMHTGDLEDAAGDLDLGRADADMASPLTPPVFAARGRIGHWFAGDFHVHASGASNDTGGDSDPATIKAVAIMAGLDFVVLTDHSNSTGSDTSTTEEDPALFNQGPEFPYWELAAQLSDASFLMIDGNEISPVTPEERGPTGHLGCYPRDLETFDHEHITFIDRPRGSVDGANVIAQARDAGCFITLNHPFGPTSWVSFDWSARSGWDAVEVWNGGAGFDTFDKRAIQGWACDLAQGQVATAIGGSDNHRVNIVPPGDTLNPPLAYPTTYVWAEELSWPSLLEGMDNQRVTITDTGTPMELDAYDEEGSWLGMMGDTLTPGEDAWLRVRGSIAMEPTTGELARSRTLEIIRVPADACDDTREAGSRAAPDPKWEQLGEWSIEQGERFDEAILISPAPGDAYFALLAQRAFRINTYQGAITNAIRVEGSD